MGPNVVFDKSFLQILTANEAALFDNYFSTTIVPTFYVEVLGDLAKEDKSPDSVVIALASKSPRQHSYPTAFFRNLIASEVAGNPIDMTMRPHVMGGNAGLANGKLSIMFNQTPEHQAFDRWQRGDFHVVERDFAKLWRTTVSHIDLASLANSVKSVKDLIGAVATQDDARNAARAFVDAPFRQAAILRHIVEKADLGDGMYARVKSRWEKAGQANIARLLAIRNLRARSRRLFRDRAHEIFRIDATEQSSRFDLSILSSVRAYVRIPRQTASSYRAAISYRPTEVHMGRRPEGRSGNSPPETVRLAG